MLASLAGALYLVLRASTAAPPSASQRHPGMPHEVHGTPYNMSLERETGIEPATNSLEGCDSTTELLPPMRLTASPARHIPPLCKAQRTKQLQQGRPLPTSPLHSPRQPSERRQKKVGGEGRVRTSVATRTAQLHSAAIDRSATSPKRCFDQSMSLVIPSSVRCV